MKPVVTVIGLGPAGPELLTAEAAELLAGSSPVWLRTARHPAAEGLSVTGSFDHLYESLDTFDGVYAAIVDRLVAEATNHGSVVYAVPGSPFVAEHTVELLRSEPRITLDVRASLGFTELCWQALGIDPMTHAVTIVDALRIRTDAAGRLGPLLVTQVHSPDVLEDVVLALDDVAPESVTILQALGTPTEVVEAIPWADLSTRVELDHLTTLWIPKLAEPLAAAVVELDELLRDTRKDSRPGSSNDQALRASVRSTADTVCAALDDLDAGADDPYADLEDALARQLLTLFVVARRAAEAGQFTVFDVVQGALDGLERESEVHR